MARNPAKASKADAGAPAAPAPGAALVRACVRIDAARVPRGIIAPQRRVRAGFVFSATPCDITVTEDTLRLIESDPLLHVQRIDEAAP